jgi:hypothetical protein
VTADEIEDAKATLAANPDRLPVELTRRLLAETISARQAVTRMAVPLEALRTAIIAHPGIYGRLLGRDLRSAIVEASEVGRDVVHGRMPVIAAGQRDILDDPMVAKRLAPRVWMPRFGLWVPYPTDIAAAAVIGLLLAASSLFWMVAGWLG